VSRARTPTRRKRIPARLAARLADHAMQSVTRLALATLAGSVLIVVPIALWASLGDGDPLRTAAVALAALLVSYGVVRQILPPLPRGTGPATGRAGSLPASSACRAALRRPARVAPIAARGRQVGRPATCRAAAPRRATGSRPVRDVRCSAATRPLARRSVRRRTRP
jgi:hypothetical protein